MEVAPQRLAVDLFSGSGAVTAALKSTGFKVVAAVDNDPIACQTYGLNHPTVKLFEQDITKLDPKALLGPEKSWRRVDLMVVCAPCQPFSSQNRKRGVDPRSLLILQCVRYAKVLQPKCIAIENVPGIASPSHTEILRTLELSLADIGYILGRPRQVDAADLAVPQRRIRCVIVASRDAAAIKLFDSTILTRPSVTVRTAIGHLSPLKSGQMSETDVLHAARSHRPIALRRLAAIPKDGGSRSSLPGDLVLACHHEANSFPDVYGRMWWDRVAPTLTTGCDDVTRGRFAHPEQDRAISLREAALLQTFPQSYRFAGSRKQIAKQIGNAVPVRMFESLAPVLKSMASCALA
jgi:DNA (cytosine-5)-methyltransferase 1